MKFIDEANIETHAGKGGDGSASFRREKFVPRGGPDGGDGGRGGSIFAQADRNINTLVDYRFKRIHRAKNGEPGRGADCNGRSAEDVILRVPVGTVVTDAETGEPVADLATHDQVELLAKGGDGGRGNLNFKSSTNRAPRQFTRGGEGDSRRLKLELKVLADVGLLGMPNAGKSTFIRAVSAAKPKVADYPFTTLHPNLGMVRVDDNRSFVIADIPGLIEGAAEGAGLGHQFLRHLADMRHKAEINSGISSTWRRMIRAQVRLKKRARSSTSCRNTIKRCMTNHAGWCSTRLTCWSQLKALNVQNSSSRILAGRVKALSSPQLTAKVAAS